MLEYRIGLLCLNHLTLNVNTNQPLNLASQRTTGHDIHASYIGLKLRDLKLSSVDVGNQIFPIPT